MFQKSLEKHIEGVGVSKMTNALVSGTAPLLEFLRTVIFLKIIY